jgi:hypothetical protein
MWRVCITIVAVENQWYFIVCVRDLWHVRLYNIFPHHAINGTIFVNKIVYWFSLQLVSETFFFLRRIQRHTVINVHSSSRKVPVIVVRNFLDRFLEKHANIEFRENLSSGSRGVPYGRTDVQKHDKPISLSSQFCECVCNIQTHCVDRTCNLLIPNLVVII